MHGLPDGYTMRPGTMTDIEGVANLANLYGRRITGSDLIDVRQLEAQIMTPGFSIEDDMRTIVDEAGKMAAVGMVVDVEEPHVQVTAWGIVDSEHQGIGLGSALYDWILGRSRQAIGKAPPDARVVLHQNTFEKDEAAAAFLASRGFEPSRHFWRMAIDLTGEIQTPVWPDGIAPTGVDIETELEDTVRATNEAFKDHYGHVERPLEEVVERSRKRIEADPDYDPDLNFVARDGGEIAGVCFCRPLSGTDRDTGYVGALAVLKPWRKKGLGMALLLEAFARFRAKGKTAAHLHVDAQSITGATRLYEKAGMHIDQLSHEQELELRPGKDWRRVS